MKGLSSKLDHQESSHNSLTEDYYKNVSKVPEKLGIVQKDLGAFYTEKEIVSYVLQHLDIKDDTTVLDPSCGCGSFLFPLYYMAKLTSKPSLLNIYGVDIDERAVSFTRNALKSIIGDQSEKISATNILLGDFVFNNLTLESLTSRVGSLKRVMNKGGFDYIIGNPPYNVKNLTKKKVTLTKDFHRKIAHDSKNIPIYFILKGLELLKDDGMIAFVLPKSLLYVKKYEEFRKYILGNFTVTRIAEIGMKFKNVRGEQVIIFIKKSIPDKSSKIDFVSLYKTSNNLMETPFSVPQIYFLDKPSIPIFSDPDIFSVIGHITSNSRRLSDFFEYRVFRGPSLHVTNIIEGAPQGRTVSANSCIRGKDVAKGRLRRICLFDTKSESSLKIEKLRKPKILMQNIYSSESGIISYLDDIGIVTTETVTNIFMPDYNKLKFFYALLNSKLINFYLFNVIFSQSKLTMHMDGYYIGQIPIVWKEDSDELKEIERIVELMQNRKESELKELLSKLDTLVYNLFGLNAHLIKIVENVMSTVLSIRSNW